MDFMLTITVLDTDCEEPPADMRESIGRALENKIADLDIETEGREFYVDDVAPEDDDGG